MITNTRTIHTGLYTDLAFETLIHGTIGQLSDGWGEYNSKNAKYWKFMNFKRAEDNELLLEVSDGFDTYFRVNSAFERKSDFEIREWLADVLKKTVKLDMHDNPSVGEWNRYNGHAGNYFKSTVQEAYLIYEVLKGRSHANDKYSQIILDKVIGHPLTAKQLELKNAIACVNQNLANALALAENEYNAKVAQLRADAENEIARLKSLAA